ncbi:Peptidase S41 family protein [Lachnellula suecica]|uniref:Peptidase S41 family protein n=1 Tax=Lachnellula suecica TaxID=602035 RepID=A0A8T9CII0_9HELO|nr:Peptidase S41 family protein [Lachnellula suecica]
MRLFQLPSVLLVSIFRLSLPAAAQNATTSAGNPQSTACGEIVNDPRSNDPDNIPVFNASLIYECLTSVPFNPAVATDFILYYNDTIQFQSTLQYLKNPPTSYQQPGIDLVGGLAQLQAGINKNVFQNQYEFEAALAALLLSAHDSHLILDSGILAAFSFGSPVDLVSVSSDGVQTPKVYIATDVAYNDDEFTPSAVSTINGEDVVAYLERFAAQNSWGGLESHTDWNQLFFSAAEGIQDDPNVFTGDAIFYPGDTITFVLENGTSITENFLGVYYSQGNTGPLQTGGDFFNFFVLGIYPDSYDPDLVDNNTVNITASSVSASSAGEATSTVLSVSGTSTVTEVFLGGAIASIGGFAVTTTESTSASASTSTSVSSCVGLNSDFYPTCADVAQSDLVDNGFGVTGYFNRNSDVAVLSIPSFYTSSDDDLASFDAAVAEFITNSKAAGMTKVVIDLQANDGGGPLLAIDTFKRFFPNVDPYGGSRLRATSPADILGQTLTNVFQGLNSTNDNYFQLVNSEWVATTKLNANTNQTFASWPEFFGPSESNGDYFTTPQRYDFNNDDFVAASFGDSSDNFTIYGYGSEKTSATATPFAAENIIMLSDGNCASSCALFMEMMHHEAGVRVVAVGGRPTTGPMQAPAGTRGAIQYDTVTLDGSISSVQTVLEENNSPQQGFLPDRTDTGEVYVTYASVNLRDQVRMGETTPLQFAYVAADCRIFYTMNTIFNYTNLWQYAADAIWTNPSLCVANSTGYATAANSPSNFATGPNGTVTKPQVLTLGEIASSLSLTNTSLSDLDTDTTLYDFIPSGLSDPPTPCKTDRDCTALESSEACVSNVNCDRRRCVNFTDACGNTSGQCLAGCPTPKVRCGPNNAICTNQLAIFETTVAKVDPTQGVCPWKAVCKPPGKTRQRTVGTNPIKSRSTSKQAKKP